MNKKKDQIARLQAEIADLTLLNEALLDLPAEMFAWHEAKIEQLRVHDQIQRATITKLRERHQILAARNVALREGLRTAFTAINKALALTDAVAGVPTWSMETPCTYTDLDRLVHMVERWLKDNQHPFAEYDDVVTVTTSDEKIVLSVEVSRT